MTTRRPDLGVTLTELMVVVAIVGIASAAARPFFGRDRGRKEGGEFASLLARDFQRVRLQAVSDRLPVRAFVFSDRVEFRNAVAGTSLSQPPRPAELTDPVLRVDRARLGTAVWAVTTSGGSPGSQVLTTASAARIEWSTLGQATVVDVVSTAITVYLRNSNRPVGSRGRDFRILISPLSGSVSTVEGW
jgi:prepilin-type N-terminal cleavage/methylation domain-containing protein